MQEKFLETLSPRALAKNFNFNGQVMPFREYLIREVLPYLDLRQKTIMLKTDSESIEVALTDFIEDAVLYTCQNRYGGDFLKYAKENVVSGVHKQEDEQEKTKKESSEDSKKYVFFENLEGPKYLVTVVGNNVVLTYKEDKFEVIMQEEQEKRDFLKRIKKMDTFLFSDIYREDINFKNFVRGFKDDKIFFSSLMIGVENNNSFDKEIEEQIDGISGIIGLVDSGKLFEVRDIEEALEAEQAAKDPIKARIEKVKNTFDIAYFPSFDSGKCLRIVETKCISFYDEFVRSTDAILKENSISEKAEYIIKEYLTSIINDKFIKYVKSIAKSVSDDAELGINEDFISEDLDTIISNLRHALKKLFVKPYEKNDDDISDVYINIVVDAIEIEIVNYEKEVNSAIETRLNELGYELRTVENGSYAPGV